MGVESDRWTIDDDDVAVNGTVEVDNDNEVEPEGVVRGGATPHEVNTAKVPKPTEKVRKIVIATYCSKRWAQSTTLGGTCVWSVGSRITDYHHSAVHLKAVGTSPPSASVAKQQKFVYTA